MSATSICRSLALGILLTQVATQYNDPHDVESANEAGAAGPSSGDVGMSSAGLIALCTIVGVVVMIGIGSAALFYIAKKRQWAMREAIRKSSRRVVQAVKTPLTPRFPRTPKTPRPPTRGREEVESSQRRAKTQQRKQTDLEKDAALSTVDEKQGSERSAKGWNSYFSFGRS